MDKLVNPPTNRHDTVLPLPPEVRADAWAVDAACSGNPGPMEYQAIDLQTGARVFHFLVPSTVPTISGSSSPSSMPSPFAGIRACTTRRSTATHITPSSGCRSASARPNWSARLRRNSYTRSSCVPKPGYRPTTTATLSSSGRRRSGARCRPISEENNNRAAKNGSPIVFASRTLYYLMIALRAAAIFSFASASWLFSSLTVVALSDSRVVRASATGLISGSYSDRRFRAS